MIDAYYQQLSAASPYLIYLALLAVPFIENVFPPFPSDIIIVICGALIAKGTIAFIPAILISSLGSEAGFIFLYYLGTKTDKKIIQAGKLKFISRDALQNAEVWFTKYGYFLILFNRFISGVRSVISFFAGMSELPVKRTIILSTISALLYHTILISLGFFFGTKVQEADAILSLYGNIVLVFIAAVVIFIALRFYIKRIYRKNSPKP
jgi:membrane protein DedA with SNARE-associated domain